MSSYFVTGTDTDAGKTVASAAILSILLNRGVDSVPVKPAQTGCDIKDGELDAPDLDFTIKITGVKIESDDKDLLSPYRYQPACSPHLAAEMLGEEIELDKIINSVEKLKKKHDSVIVEGAGGIMVPINNNEMMIDLMSKLNLPVILTARPGLGTINHTLLSLSVLRSRNINIAGVIICATEPLKGDFIEEDNIKSIEKYGNIKVLGTIPYIENLDELSAHKFFEIVNQSITLPK